MKLILILAGMAASGFLGYLVEPSLRKSLTGVASVSSENEVVAQVVSGIDPATLAPEQLPENVTLKKAIRFSDQASGLSMTLDVGGKVQLVGIDGSDSMVRPGGTEYTIKVPIADTDLREQLAANPPPPVVAKPDPQPAKTEEVPAAPVAEEAPVTEPPVTAPPVPEPPVAEVPAADETPVIMVESEEETPPAAPPSDAPQEPAAVSTDVVAVMQASIRAGEIKEFKFDQVLEWKAEPDETVDGVAFQVGSASYKAETIFGVKTIQAKALITQGKVQRWIWPKSGMEIK